MNPELDLLLTRATVRLENIESGSTIGTGIVYKHASLHEKVYVLTAAHCLFQDGDSFTMPLESIDISFYSPGKRKYEGLRHVIDDATVSAVEDKDLAVLILNLSEVEAITGPLPEYKIVRDRNDIGTFLIKGFPSAAEGKEIVTISPIWSQQLPTSNRFQLYLNQDFSDQFDAKYRVDGFSGSGAFLYDHGQLYLYGIFTRFLEAGKLIYCQYLSSFEEILEKKYLPLLNFSFFGAYGLTPEFFKDYAAKSIEGLGPRFDAELNFRLPIAYCFNALARDVEFKRRLLKEVDGFLAAPTYGSGSAELADFFASYEELRNLVQSWFGKIDWQSIDQISIDAIRKGVEDLEKMATAKRSELYQRRLVAQAQQKEGEKKYSYTEPFASEITQVGQMNNNAGTFLAGLEELHIGLSNQPFLFIKGNAGAGKSHMLGDIVLRRNAEGQPAVLLLGQLFRSDQSIWQNILDQLGLTCTKDQLLNALDSIGKQAGCRVLIMIDAINEGAGKKLWHDALPGLLFDVAKYPHIGLALSVRTTYWEAIMPQRLRDGRQMTVVEHEGFRGSEYEAVTRFCEHYKIQQPNFPLLNPEYSNPLFLHLICQGIEATSERVFPQGFQGFTKVFGYYIKALSDRMKSKREEYELQPKLVKLALEEFGRACFAQKTSRSLLLEDAIALFQSKFADFPRLLADLIDECVLIRSLVKSYSEDEEKEYVYFSYERFGDFFMADELVKSLSSREEVIAEFSKGQPLGQLIENGQWYNDGVLEALAVVLPERFGIEIMEAYSWVYSESARNYYHLSSNSFSHWFVNSLKWRRLDSIDDEKLTKWIRSKRFRYDDDQWFYFLYEICSVAGHAFNSDRLTRTLMSYSMPERDGFFQMHMQGYHGRSEDVGAYPITRLIDWAWRAGISVATDGETARLVGQALTWLLSSSNNELRDQATKAMVNLLYRQPEALEGILQKFSQSDDMYILERLYAVAYGCALRSVSDQSLKTLATIVYTLVFSSDNPPRHLLLRDYARNILEYANAKGIDLESVEMKRVRPPYSSAMPKRFPTEEEVRRHEVDPKSELYEPFNGRANAHVIFSCLDWDFGRYELDPAVGHFESVRFTFEGDLDRFKASLPKGGKSKLSRLWKFYDLYTTPEDRRKRIFPKDEQKRLEFWESVKTVYEEMEYAFEQSLDEEQKIFFREEVYPYWDSKMRQKRNSKQRIESRPIKLWIANRVFELGYDHKIHGHYDRMYSDGGRSEHKLERIGKKYQWIAFYEILAILSDNYKIRDTWGNKTTSWYYRGPWDVTYRDIDPSFIDRRQRDKYGEDDFGLADDDGRWFMPDKYEHWKRLKADWRSAVADLPNAPRAIHKKDNSGEEWFYLYFSYTWKEPKAIGERGFDSSRKEIWYMFQPYFVPERKYEVILNWLKNQDFHGRWLPENHDESNLLARENYWSPISVEIQKKADKWEKLEGSTHKVMLPTKEGTGHLSEDYSGVRFDYKMPCRELYDTMGLRYSQIDGEFEDEKGNVVFSNLSPVGPMIRKETLFAFLKAKGYRIIWTLLGEKNAFNDSSLGDVRKSISGVYLLDGEEIKGDFKVNNW